MDIHPLQNMESALNRPHVAVTSTMQGDEMQGKESAFSIHSYQSAVVSRFPVSKSKRVQAANTPSCTRRARFQNV